MDTTLTESGPFERVLTVRLDPSELRTARSQAAAKLSADLKIKGFRPGKAPVQMVERAVGAERLRNETLEVALPDIVDNALKEAEIIPATIPTVAETREDGDAIEVDLRITLWPKLDDVPSYQDRRIEIESADVVDADVEEQLERLRTQFAELEDVARPADEGDFVLVDISARQGGSPIEEASATDFLYEVGSGSFLPGLDEPLTGTTAGDIRKFVTTLPGGLADVATETAEVQVLVKGVKAKRLPDLSDEWVDDVSEFATVGELRQGLRRELAEWKKAAGRAELRAKLLDALVREADVILPDPLVAAEMDDLLLSLLRRLEAQGAGLDDYLRAAGQEQDDFVAELRAQAERNLAVRIVLEAVIEAEGIEVAAEEVDVTIARLAEAAGEEAEAFRSRLVDGGRIVGLVGDMLRQKALDHIVASAEPVDANGDPLDLLPQEPAVVDSDEVTE